MPSKTSSLPEAISGSIPKIFDQAQNTTANHQKNVVALHKIHCDAATFTEPVHNGKSIKLTGERLFEDAFIGMLCRVLVVKKGIPQADRIVKFTGAYTKYMNEKAIANDDDDTTASRFVVRLLKFLLSGFVAKDKIVRYRCVRILAEIVAHLGEIDEDVYMILRSALVERTHDKETHIRVQAVVALSKLCGSEDPADAGQDEPTAIDVLLDTLSCDPAAEVRRAALLNIPLAPHTLSAILARTRDTDTIMRKLVYSAVLETHCLSPDHTSMGFVHPRALSIAQRELIIRNGLGDREPAVRAAAGSLLGTWVDVVRGVKAEDNKGVQDDVIALLKLFDLHESTIAEGALLSIFATRSDIFEQLEFKEHYWKELIPERTFLARVFVEHCISIKNDSKLDASIPVVTHLAFEIQNAYNAYLDHVDAVSTQEDEFSEEQLVQEEDARLDREFVIGELLRLAVSLDYADELGRRKMFQLVRDMISQEALPESLVARCLDVLRMLSPSERDLIRVVVEVVHELRDRDTVDDELEKDHADDGETTIGDTSMAASVPSVRKAGPPKEVQPLSAEEQAQADALDVRCLSLCIGMLERVNGTFEENSTLEGILGELIVPSVKRKELPLREKGLICLGLCCLIARRMALNSFQLFLSQIQAAPEVLKLRVLQIVFDVLMVHDGEFLGRGSASGERIVEFLLHVLNVEESDKVQALMCIGLAKLVLSGTISDERVLKSLVVAYLSPDTVQNQELRQCLSYFFPVLCYSASANQRRMAQVAIPLFEQLAQATRELEDDQEMVPPAQIIGMFVDWTDPLKVLDVQEQKIDDSVHVDLAIDVMKTLFKDDVEKEDKKVLCQVLGRLHLPEAVDDDKIRILKLLVHNISMRRPLQDVVARNALIKFDLALTKRYAEQLAGFSEAEYRELSALKALFDFLGEIVPLDEEESLPRTRAKKRRSESVATQMTESSAPGEDSSATSAASLTKPKIKGKRKQAKRRRVSESDDEDLPDMHATPVPSRTLRKRVASTKNSVLPQVVGEQQENENENENQTAESSERTPVPSSRQKTQLHAGRDAQALSVGSIMLAPVMGTNDEDDEEEVDEILSGTC